MEETQHLMQNHDSFQSKPLNMGTKLEGKGSFCIDALLSKNEENPESSRSISPTSTRSQNSPPISPGSEDVAHNSFVPKPGLLNQIYHNPLYGYQGQSQVSAFHSLDGTILQKVQMPLNHHSHNQLHQMQLDWLARSGVFYPRLPDLSGEIFYIFFTFNFFLYFLHT